MKKVYITPFVFVINCNAKTTLLSVSGVGTESDSNINMGYGGVDPDGVLNPGSRELEIPFPILPF